jgi:hypothetical protein
MTRGELDSKIMPEVMIATHLRCEEIEKRNEEGREAEAV